MRDAICEGGGTRLVDPLSFGNVLNYNFIK
jgi:hypothetical protein